MDLAEVRKANLIALIGDPRRRGAVAEFARAHNLDPTYIRQILNDHRPMGEKSARNFESQLGLAPFSLDAVGTPEKAKVIQAIEEFDRSEFAELMAQIDLIKRRKRGELK